MESFGAAAAAAALATETDVDAGTGASAGESISPSSTSSSALLPSLRLSAWIGMTEQGRENDLERNQEVKSDICACSLQLRVGYFRVGLFDGGIEDLSDLRVAPVSLPPLCDFACALALCALCCASLDVCVSQSEGVRECGDHTYNQLSSPLLNSDSIRNSRTTQQIGTEICTAPAPLWHRKTLWSASARAPSSNFPLEKTDQFGTNHAGKAQESR